MRICAFDKPLAEGAGIGEIGRKMCISIRLELFAFFEAFLFAAIALKVLAAHRTPFFGSQN